MDGMTKPISWAYWRRKMTMRLMSLPPRFSSTSVKRYAYELLNRAETMQLVENLKRTSPPKEWGAGKAR